MIEALVVVFSIPCKPEPQLSFGFLDTIPVCLHSISVFILCSLFLLPPPATYCLFELETVGFALEAMTSPLGEAGLLTSPLGWWAGNWLKSNWTLLQICLPRAIKHKNTYTTSGYGSICALDILQMWKMHWGNIIAHTQPCYFLSLSIRYWLLLEEGRQSLTGSDRKWPCLYSYVFSLSIIHAKNMKVKSEDSCLKTRTQELIDILLPSTWYRSLPKSDPP